MPLLFLAQQQQSDRPVYLLFGGAVGLLVSVLVVSRTLVGEKVAAPGWRALAHWMPIAMTGLVAALLGHPEIGVGIAFGTSVAALSTIVGFLVLSGIVDTIPPRAKRLWTFLPVVTTLAFLLGFRGNLTIVEAVILVAQGAMALLVWQEPGEGWDDGIRREPAALAVSKYDAMVIVAALALAGVAAWACTRGAEELSRKDVRYPTGLLASTVLSVVLVMPMIGSGVPLASEGRAWAPVTAQVGLVLLNLCALLPLVIITPLLVAKVGPQTAAVAATAASAAPTEPPPLIYPRTVWRIDAVTILILSLVLVPVAAGRVKLDKQVAAWLIVGYCLYLLSVLIVNARGL